MSSNSLQYSGIKLAIVIIVTLAGIVFAAPNFLPASVRASLPTWMKPLPLGLDLQGGSYLLLEVDTAAVAKEHLDDQTEIARAALRDAKIGYRALRATDDGVYVTLTKPEDAA